MWFQSLTERILAIIGTTVVLVAFVLANPMMPFNSYRHTTAPYRGAGGGGGPVDPPEDPPDPPPDPGAGDLIIWAAGDNCDDDFTSQQTTNVEGCKWVGDMIKAENATDRVLLLGDTQYEEGESANYTNYFDKGMGKQQIFSGSTESIWTRSIAAVGNHEYLTTNAAPFYSYFGTTRSGDPLKGYFMTDLGDWRIITLNSNCSYVGNGNSSLDGCGASDPQGVWAANALDDATTAGDSTVVIYHHPPFTDGAGYAPGTNSGLVLWQIAYDHGADLVLTGHDHQFQRFGPLSRTGTPQTSGPQFFVSGAGGKGNNEFSTLPGTDRTLYEWGKQPDGTQKEPGALRLVLEADGDYTFSFRTNGSGGIVNRNSGSGTSR